MKTIVESRENCICHVTDRIEALVKDKPDAVIAIACGRTMQPLFAELVSRVAKAKLSLHQVSLFSVAELEKTENCMSCRYQLESELVEKTDLDTENCFFLNEKNLEQYDTMIAERNGLDLIVLGLGDNAHIGYNEPAVPFNSVSHRQKLTDATRRQNAERFGGQEMVPEFALTMGIKTIVTARDILVLAFGEEKAEAVHKMLYARDDSAVPAAFLQIPANVTVYVDESAAAKL